MWDESGNGNGGGDYRQSAETVGFTSMGRWESGKVGKWGSLREPTDVRSARGGMAAKAEMRCGRFCGLGGL